ncbi:hypothetical protein V6N13_120559 [Hibiscus sabdariffa]
MKYHSEFKTILEQKNGNCYDILDKTLEQLCRKSIKPRGQGSKATAFTNVEFNVSPQTESYIIYSRNGCDKSVSLAGFGMDETPKKLKRKSPGTDKQAKSKADEQSTEQKKGKTSKKSKSNSPTTSKEKILLEQTGSQSPEGTLPGESPKSGTRRTRVMQGLGLIAPPGMVLFQSICDGLNDIAINCTPTKFSPSMNKDGLAMESEQLVPLGS